MRAVALVDKRKFEVKEIKKPTPKKGEVVIEILKTGICGSDLHYFEMGEPKGLILGHEFCGKVVDPGSRKDLKVGELVAALPISPCGECFACKSGNPQYCRKTWSDAVGLSLTRPGGLGEVVCVRPDMVLKLPKGVTEEETTLKRDRVETFSKMNDLYRNRNRITKKLLENGKGKEFLQAVAEAYA